MQRESVSRTKLKKSASFTTSTTLSYTGVSVTIPANSIYAVEFELTYSSGRPSTIAVSTNQASAGVTYVVDINNDPCVFAHACGMTENSLTLYVFAKYEIASRQNAVYVRGWHMPI